HIWKMLDKQPITLLITGPINLDEYWHETSRMDDIIGASTNRNVRREEMLDVDITSYPVSFGGQRIGDTLKGFSSDGNDRIVEVSHGHGQILWCPIPVELNERNEAIIALYQYALDKAGVAEHLIWQRGNVPGIYGRKLDFEHGSLFIFVSECGQDIRVDTADPTTNSTYAFTVEAERTVMFTTDRTG